MSQDVLIVSAQALVAHGISNLLSADSTLNVRSLITHEDDFERGVGVAVASLDAPVIVCDIESARKPWLDVVISALERSSLRRVVVVISPGSSDVIPTLFSRGVRAIVGRDADPDELIRAVSEVVAGHASVSRGLLNHVLVELAQVHVRSASMHADNRGMLAPREVEILDHLVRGMTNRQIASALNLSEATVKVYLGRIMSKWHVRDRLQVALKALGRLEAVKA